MEQTGVLGPFTWCTHRVGEHAPNHVICKILSKLDQCQIAANLARCRSNIASVLFSTVSAFPEWRKTGDCGYTTHKNTLAYQPKEKLASWS
jgi:hypothetical protein